MLHPPLAAIAAPGAPPASPGAAPPLAAKRRGNPNLPLALRCGARTRGGCACRAPAIHGKLRCRMHGGRSTGPRTAEGMARLRAARTVHGVYGAAMRALNRHDLTALRRGVVGDAAVRCVDRLPADLVERLWQMPPELRPPPWPSGGLTPAEDRAVVRAEAEALAPWRAAIAQAGGRGRRRRATSQVSSGGISAAQAGAHAPVRLDCDAAGLEDAADSAPADGAAEAHAPVHVATARGGDVAAAPAAPAPAALPTEQARADAPERDGEGQRGAATTPLAAQGDAMQRQAEAHAPEGNLVARGAILAAGTTRAERRRLALLHARRVTAPLSAAPLSAQAEAHAPERAGELGRGAATVSPETHDAGVQPLAKAHAPEGSPAAAVGSPAAGTNRAARRRLKYLQKRSRRTTAARLRP